MDELSERQKSMLKVLSLNNGYPISVGLMELIDKEFSALMTSEHVDVHRGSDSIIWARITPKGVRAIPEDSLPSQTKSPT